MRTGLYSLFARKNPHIGNTRKNPFLMVPLGIVTIVAAMPQNALAFEMKVAERRQTSLIARVAVSRTNTPLFADPTFNPWQQLAAVSESPITIEALWQQPLPVVIAKAPEPAPVPQEAPPVAPKPQTAPATPAKPPVPPAAPGSPTLVLEGEASYYSRAGCLGCDPQMIMANGQPLNDAALTMAIGAHLKHLVGRKARVTSLATGKSVEVRITDTGGFYKAKYGNRVADLTVATKNAIGMAGGVGQVRVEVF